ncbi:MAG TPA: DUF4124 domain-containing protein [Albitalea sp.]|uniref:DUF4124 domain-containing protein n=1 Tax=Piscinibacter sp. TaxID=1903157 RepID=UPI002ED1A132
MRQLEVRAVPVIRNAARLVVVASLACAGAGQALAAIYSCVDANGKKLTSDRPIAACADRDQRVLNPDGSVRRVLPPTPTADERAEQEARDRQAAVERAAQSDAVRRDRNLMVRFPNEAAHNKARAKALDDMHNAVQLSEKRLAALAVERKPLTDETEFYVGKPLPHKLRQQLDANDAAADAQRALIQNQQAEIVRINGLFDAELARLRRLWSGAPPGSMGTLPPALAGSAAKTASQ